MAAQDSRRRILDYLHERGHASVRELAALLHVTLTGARQHLAVLEEEGLIVAREERGAIGRPARIYSLSDEGEARYPKRYHDLANMLMEEVRAIAGSDALQQVLRRIALRQADGVRARVEGKPLAERVQETVTILHGMGISAEAETRDGELLIHQTTCPYPAVARCNRGVCALDVNFVRSLTGADVRLTAGLLRGGSRCTYRIRPAPLPVRAQ